MSEPRAHRWQILFPDGLSEAQVTRLAEFATDSGIEESLHGVDDRSVFRYDYDRATVELYRHLFQKILGRTELTANNRMVLADRLAELDTWAESTTMPE
ncbi:hypothetical protein F3087_24325 [Nocardia colli]|uniref:Uncharacterized protein n=1 Tax=Nocardia colli TaxID=2545717 RepID=A0A5N0EBM7_9NOCA|nr:hypothetical protein [Nocardia colli]KAA8886366.1 hypothetical protein F3087_24325 [Nocardia colli]